MHVQEALKIRHTFVHRQHCDFDMAENMYALTNRFLIIWRPKKIEYLFFILLFDKLAYKYEKGT